jgi:hypothetical protein
LTVLWVLNLGALALLLGAVGWEWLKDAAARASWRAEARGNPDLWV